MTKRTSAVALAGLLALTGCASTTTTPASVVKSTAPAASTPVASKSSAAPTVPAEYISALAKAEIYANTMNMSKAGVYDQLTSAAGEQFSAAAGKYAVDNVKADWNANALAKAKIYQTTMHMSPAAIHDQLISQAGEKFTPAEADYAIQHLNG